MRTRNHDWFNTKTGRTLYSFQVYHQGKWRHVAEDGKPLLFTSQALRDGARKKYRSWRTLAAEVYPARDAYDTLNDKVAELQNTLTQARGETLACGLDAQRQERAREVDAAMVERALAAYFAFYDEHGAGTGADGHAMRAALHAALGREAAAMPAAPVAEPPRCPKCGYTYEDCCFNMDHHLCGEPTPPPSVRAQEMEVFGDGYKSGYEHAMKDSEHWPKAAPAVEVDEAMKLRAAEAIANARAGRRGAPAVSNVLDILPPKLLTEVMEDADAALTAALGREGGGNG